MDLLGLGRFLISVELVLELEANVKLPLDSEAGISGPQSGERLANRTYGVLHREGLQFTSDWRYGPIPVLPCEGVEDGDQVPVQY